MSSQDGDALAEEMAVDAAIVTIKRELKQQGKPIPPTDQLRATAVERLGLLNRRPSAPKPSS